MKTTLRLVGDTYPMRDQIRAAGWEYNAERKYWQREIDEQITDTITTAHARQYRGTFRGCALYVAVGTGVAVEVWRSSSYVSPAKKSTVRVCAACGDMVPCVSTPIGWMCEDCRGDQ